jgi:Domain of unknown function (DUF4180)
VTWIEFTGAFDASAAVARCLEHRVRGLLFDDGALPPAFFDLRTGVAGDLLQKLANYRIRMAAVVPDPSAHGPRFRELADEANRGRQLRFAAIRADAIAWLESG